MRPIPKKRTFLIQTFCPFFCDNTTFFAFIISYMRNFVNILRGTHISADKTIKSFRQRMLHVDVRGSGWGCGNVMLTPENIVVLREVSKDTVKITSKTWM